MRRRPKKLLRSPLFLIGFLLLVLSLSTYFVESLRSKAIALIPFTSGGNDEETQFAMQEAIQSLQLENNRLREEADGLRNLLTHEGQLLAQYHQLQESAETPPSLAETWSRRHDELTSILAFQIASIPANVIYRTPSTWSSTLWVNVGEKTNDLLGRKVVAQGSPVLYGSSLVGVIDLVNASRSRVRLLTDSSLRPAVRASRKTHLLAKGELQGSAQTSFRMQSQTLKGVGFNYDYSDEFGPARDLRSGKAIDIEEEDIAILEEGDLLITSGLDGVFPKGLDVGIVSKIDILKEGDYAYSLEAIPTAGDFNSLTLLHILPPL